MCNSLDIDVSAIIGDHNQQNLQEILTNALDNDTEISERESLWQKLSNEYCQHASKPGVWLNNSELTGYLLTQGYIQKGIDTISLSGTIVQFINNEGRIIGLFNNAQDNSAGNIGQATGTHWQAVLYGADIPNYVIAPELVAVKLNNTSVNTTSIDDLFHSNNSEDNLDLPNQNESDTKEEKSYTSLELLDKLIRDIELYEFNVTSDAASSSPSLIHDKNSPFAYQLKQHISSSFNKINKLSGENMDEDKKSEDRKNAKLTIITGSNGSSTKQKLDLNKKLLKFVEITNDEVAGSKTMNHGQDLDIFQNAFNQKDNSSYYYQATDIRSIQKQIMQSYSDNFSIHEPIGDNQVLSDTIKVLITSLDEKPTLCVYNIGNRHWVSFAALRMEDQTIILYKDSMGGSNPKLEKAIKLRIPGAKFKANTSKEQTSGVECGIFALQNMKIMAEQISYDKEGFSGRFKEYTGFCSLKEAKALRAEAFADQYVVGKYHEMLDEAGKAEALKLLNHLLIIMILTRTLRVEKVKR